MYNSDADALTYLSTVIEELGTSRNGRQLNPFRSVPM